MKSGNKAYKIVSILSYTIIALALVCAGLFWRSANAAPQIAKQVAARNRPRMQPSQQVTIPPGYTTWDAEYQRLLQRGWAPEKAERIIAGAQQNMQRDQMRKWRYRRGLPTQNPTLWDKAWGYMEGDPW